MPTPRSLVKTDLTRVWVMEDGAGPKVAPEYEGVWKAGAVSWDFGEETKIEIPSDSAYGEFQEVDSIPGTEGKPSITFTARFARNVSDMLRLARRRCYHDFQVHIGLCQDLQDFNGGWDKVLVLERGHITQYNTDDLGALASDERAAVNENIPVQGRDYYEIKRLDLAEICSASVIQEVIAVVFADKRTCGECGDSSDGWQKLLALVKAVGGSPGLGAQIVYSDGAGATCAATPITTLGATEEPDDMSPLGIYTVVVSQDSNSHHYAETEDILDGAETWAEHGTGYEVGGEPKVIFVLKPGYAWVGGAGGYIYFLDNPANDPVIQDAGAATTQPINAIHAYDEDNVLAVGNSNAVIHTTDGETWAAVTGPSIGVNLNTCWMLSKTTWLVGTAGGRLYYTYDSGTTWTEKGFTGSGAGVVRDIRFVNGQVGYMSHDTVTPAGRILRTINGGYSWYVMPEGAGSIPANDRINSLATCGDPNIIVGGGLAGDASDGILVKGS